MKKIFPLCIRASLAFCLCFSLFTVFPAASAAETVKLTYSSFFPPTHVQSQLSESWCREVENRTDGRIKIQYYAGQTLTNTKQTYDSVMEGIADIGTSGLAYTRGRFPLMSAVDLPFGYTSGVAATVAANDVYAKFKPKEFSDTKVLYFHAHGPGMLHTRGKAVRTLEDIKGLKIRSTGTSAEVATALGGTPVPMPMPESYQSLQKGVVDASMHPVEANKGWKLGEVTRYATFAYPSGYTTAFFVVMNKDKWNSLDPKDQNIIEEINLEWAAKHGEAWDTSDMEGVRFFLEQGNTIFGLDAKESAKWENAVAPVIDRYAAELDKKGLNGKAVIGSIRESLKKFH